MSHQPCLPVPPTRKRSRSVSCQEPIQFDDIQGIDASEYLRRVVEQASEIPEVMVSSSSSSLSTTAEQQWCPNTRVNQKNYMDPPIQGSAASLYYLVSTRTALSPAPSADHVASRAWATHVVENFVCLRDYVETCRLAGVGGKDHRQPVPALKDINAWHVFCLGENDAVENDGKEEPIAIGVGRSNEEEVQQQSDQSVTIPLLWKQNLSPTGFPPTVALLSQMDQVMVRRVLAHLVHIFRTRTTGNSVVQLSSWIYALLVRLDAPLHRDDAAVLYDLLKHLSIRRASCTIVAPDVACSRRHELTHINLLMVIVGIYFEQGGGYNAIMRLRGKNEQISDHHESSSLAESSQ
jgi:hypothetical protein